MGLHFWGMELKTLGRICAPTMWLSYDRNVNQLEPNPKTTEPSHHHPRQLQPIAAIATTMIEARPGMMLTE